MTKPDFSEFLTGDKFDQEEAGWEKANREGTGHRLFANAVNLLNPKSVIEFGCGTGWTAQGLTCKHYLGVDANLRCLELASKRVPRGEFMHADIREFAKQFFHPREVVLSTAFLKHFGLHEWDAIFADFMRYGGKNAVFTMQIWTEDKDNGESYHHTYIAEEHLQRAITEAGHTLISRELCAEDEHGAEWLFITKRT
jgi:trans-aconitate methyltransferase